MNPYRGVTKSGEVVEGYWWYHPFYKKHFIRVTNNRELIDYEVHPASLAQNTTVKDKDGKPIFGSFEVEGKMTRGGDRIRVYNWGVAEGEILGETNVVWDNDEKGFRYSDYSEDLAEDVYDMFRNVEIIGTQWKGTE